MLTPPSPARLQQRKDDIMARRQTNDDDHVQILQEKAEKARRDLAAINQQIREADHRLQVLQEEADQAKAAGDADTFQSLRRQLRQLEDDLDTMEVKRTGLQQTEEAARAAFWIAYVDTHARTMKALAGEYEAMREQLFTFFRSMAQRQSEYLQLREKYDPMDGPLASMRSDDNLLKLPEDADFFTASGLCPEPEAAWMVSVMRTGSAMSMETSEAIAKDIRLRQAMQILTGRNRLA